MKFALREVTWPETNTRGVALCDAATGEIVAGQTSCKIESTAQLRGGGSVTTVELNLFNLPVFPNPKQLD